MYEIGTILKDKDNRLWCIVKRQPYQASAHNDRWTDYNTVMLAVSKRSNKLLRSNTLKSTTDSSLWRLEVVGKANVVFDIDNIEFYEEK